MPRVFFMRILPIGKSLIILEKVPIITAIEIRGSYEKNWGIV